MLVILLFSIKWGIFRYILNFPIMMNRVVHFEIHCDDPERACEFYRQVFGWKIDKWPGDVGFDYWIVMTAPQDSKEMGINGGLIKRQSQMTEAESRGSNAFVCTVHVANFDETASKIEANGGKVALPKMALKGMAWQGYFLDTEGNTFGIHQADPMAQ
jgi:predicted enzyme related to lactoylglutathione lyase